MTCIFNINIFVFSVLQVNSPPKLVSKEGLERKLAAISLEAASCSTHPGPMRTLQLADWNMLRCFAGHVLTFLILIMFFFVP